MRVSASAHVTPFAWILSSRANGMRCDGDRCAYVGRALGLRAVVSPRGRLFDAPRDCPGCSARFEGAADRGARFLRRRSRLADDGLPGAALEGACARACGSSARWCDQGVCGLARSAHPAAVAAVEQAVSRAAARAAKAPAHPVDVGVEPEEARDVRVSERAVTEAGPAVREPAEVDALIAEGTHRDGLRGAWRRRCGVFRLRTQRTPRRGLARST